MNNLILILTSLFLFANPAAPLSERLHNGDEAPLFNTRDVRGEKLKLRKLLKEQDRVLLVFMRHAWCPVCNLRSHELMERYEELKAANYEVVVVYESPQEQLIRYVEDHELPFKVVADPSGELYRSYKVERNPEKMKAAMQDKKLLAHIEEGKKSYKKDFRSYMAKGEKPDALIPADFVLDHDGNILEAYYGKTLDDHLPLENLLAAKK
ncbi:peroxiredoxin-like family protein [Saprospira sp. CCB-QB6]|uniref:peroxiredoxin-like family protein n=1 Tax=Saprospira sp. CCB-QB6 TaxID=3023936 RepID=UPI00234B056B|nr:peroxiredoxin-like family protein [Saprospira sp. CCB-QB6]WCL80941.1 peroxiredoxin-like family protein [Saprospira sp. CCB-QB6]